MESEMEDFKVWNIIQASTKRNTCNNIFIALKR